MRSRCGVAAVLLCLADRPPRAADDDDPLARARQLYNQRQFDAAVRRPRRRGGRRHAPTAPTWSPRAPTSSGFATSAASDDLTNARERLRRIDPERFDGRASASSIIVGLGETLFFDGASRRRRRRVRLGARHAATRCAGDARERVLDWWASAVDREARAALRHRTARRSISGSATRMRDELAAHPGEHARRPTGCRRGGAGAGRSAGRVGRGAGRLGARAARRAIAARRCAPISIGSCCARSSPTRRATGAAARDAARASGSDVQGDAGRR